MSQQPTPPAKPSGNLFGSRPGAPQPTPSGNPFGSRPAAPQSAPAAPQPAPPPTPRPNPLTSRLGPPKTHWRIISVAPQLVRFDLNGLGDPFHRLLGKKLSVELGDSEAAIKVIEAGGKEVADMIKRLDTAWKDYHFKGAALLYPWRKEMRQVLNGRIPNGDESETEELYEDDKVTPPRILRSLDLWLVFNVLARARANILLPDAPLAMEGQFLNRSLFTHDSRLLALAQATGCIEESSLK